MNLVRCQECGKPNDRDKLSKCVNCSAPLPEFYSPETLTENERATLSFLLSDAENQYRGWLTLKHATDAEKELARTRLSVISDIRTKVLGGM